MEAWTILPRPGSLRFTQGAGIQSTLSAGPHPRLAGRMGPEATIRPGGYLPQGARRVPFLALKIF